MITHSLANYAAQAPEDTTPPAPEVPRVAGLDTAMAVTRAHGLLGYPDNLVKSRGQVGLRGRGIVRPEVWDGLSAQITPDLLRERAYLAALEAAGLVLRQDPHAGLVIDPTVPGVGSLVTVMTSDLDAERVANDLYGLEATSYLVDYDNPERGGSAWVFLVPDVDLEAGHVLDPDVDLVTIYGSPVPVFRLTGEDDTTAVPGHVHLAPPAVYATLGLEYPGPAEPVNVVEAVRMEDKAAAQEAGDDMAGPQAAARAAVEAYGHAWRSLMLEGIIPAYRLTDKFQPGLATGERYWNSVLDEIEEMEAERAKQERVERVRHLRGEDAGRTRGARLLPRRTAHKDLNLVPHLVALGQTTAVTGQYGAGKSSMVLELAATLSTPGHQFGGRFPAASTGRVVVLSTESNHDDVEFALGSIGVAESDTLTVLGLDDYVGDDEGRELSVVDLLAKAANGSGPAMDTLVDTLTADGPYHAVVLDGFKKVLEANGVTEKQEGLAGAILANLEKLVARLTTPHPPTFILSTHTTQNDAVTSGVVVDRYADIIVRLRTTAERGVTITPSHTRTLESGKRADRAGGPLERTRVRLEDGAVVLEDTPYKPRRAKATTPEPEPVVEATTPEAATPSTEVDQERVAQAVLAAAPAAGEPGVGLRALVDTVRENITATRREVEVTVESLVQAGALTDSAPKPLGRGSRAGRYIGHA